MKWIQNLKIADTCRSTYIRFPIGVIIACILSVILVFSVHSDSGNINLLIQMVASLIVVFFLSTALSIHMENMHSLSRIKKYGLHIVGIIFGIYFFVHFNADIDESFESLIFFIFSLFGILGYIFSAPYLRKQVSPSEVYYNYLYSTFSAFLYAFFSGILIMILGSIALGSIHALFSVNSEIMGYLYAYWMIFSVALVAPIFGLSMLPKNSDVNTKIQTVNSFSSFLIKYVFFPAVCVYFVILYSYSIKLALIFGDWPKGEISWMIIGFSLLGYISYIASYIYEQKNTLIRFLRKYFPYAVLPQVIILFYSIYLRIDQYGLTLNRYFIVLFGLCLAVVSLYFIFSRAKRLIAFPVICIAISLLISLGPWSVYQLPAQAQISILKNELREANILQDDQTILPLVHKNDISQELSNSVYSRIEYLCDYHSCSGLQQLFPDQYPVAEDIHDKVRGWEVVSAITDAIQVQRNYNYESHSEYIHVELPYNSSFFPLDISNYSDIIRMQGYGNKYFDYENQTIIIQHERIEQIDISSIMTDLEELKNIDHNDISIENMTYDVETEIGTVRILLERFHGNIQSPKEMGIGGYILLP